MNKVKMNHDTKEKIKNLKYWIPIILFTIIAVPIPFQNDTFFCITTGNSVLEDGFYHINNTTIHPLFSVLIAIIYRFFNLTGIYLFVVFIAVITMVVIYSILNVFHIPKPVSFFVTILILLFGNTMFTGRSQIISFLCMIMLVYCIEKLLRTNQNRYMIGIMVLHLLIVNFHTSIFLLSFLIYLPYFFEFAIRKIGKMEQRKENYRFTFEEYNIKKLVITFGISLCIGFFNPYGSYAYTYLFTTLAGVSSKYIQELQIPTLLDSFVLLIYIICLFIVISFRKTKIKLVDFVMIIMFLFCSLVANRYRYYLIFLTYLSVARIFLDFVKSNRKEFYDSFITFQISGKQMIMVVGIFMLLFSQSVFAFFTQSYVGKKDYPMEASKWILENLDYENSRFYQHYNVGSYLAWRGIPVFIDSRAELFDTGNITVLKDVYEVGVMKMTYQEFMEKYHFDYALVRKDEIIYPYLKQDENWVMIYEDNFWEVLKLRNEI